MVVVVEARPEAELVRRAAGGDAEAFGALYDLLAPDVHRFVARLLDRTRAEDVVQETFLRLHGLLGQADPDRPLRPYVLGIARRSALEALRRARPGDDRGLDAVPAPGGVPEAAAKAEEDGLLAAALAALDPDQRVVVSLRFAGALTMQALAEALDVSVPTARARLREALGRLTVELERRGLVAAHGGAR